MLCNVILYHYLSMPHELETQQKDRSGRMYRPVGRDAERKRVEAHGEPPGTRTLSPLMKRNRLAQGLMHYDEMQSVEPQCPAPSAPAMSPSKGGAGTH